MAAVGRFRNGDTIRTDAFRFTEYTDTKRNLTSRMLYDHATDPNENVNVVKARKQAVTGLAKQLRELKRRGGK